MICFVKPNLMEMQGAPRIHKSVIRFMLVMQVRGQVKDQADLRMHMHLQQMPSRTAEMASCVGVADVRVTR